MTSTMFVSVSPLRTFVQDASNRGTRKGTVPAASPHIRSHSSNQSHKNVSTRFATLEASRKSSRSSSTVQQSSFSTTRRPTSPSNRKILGSASDSHKLNRRKNLLSRLLMATSTFSPSSKPRSPSRMLPKPVAFSSRTAQNSTILESRLWIYS